MPVHSRVIRWTHWLNIPFLSLMIWSGLLIYWADDVYRIGWGETTWFRFFPQGFYEFFSLEARLAEGMAWHFFVQWFFVLNGIVWTLAAYRAREWRKFHSLQLASYIAIFFCGLGSVVTGYAIYKPVQLSWLGAAIGGYEWARFFHFWLTLAYVGFTFAHVIQVLRATLRNARGAGSLRTMIAGEAE